VKGLGVKIESCAPGVEDPIPTFELKSALPPTFNIEETVVEPVTAKLVEVAPWSDVPPETVSEESVVALAVRVPSVAPPVALNWPVTVVEPVTARDVEVAPCVERPWRVVRPSTLSVPLALRVLPTLSSPASVVEAVTNRLVEVAPPEIVSPPPSVPLPIVEEA